MNARRQNRESVLQDIPGLAADLRRLAHEHVEIGRRLSLLAQRIETGEVDQVPSAQILGEPVERILRAILRGEGNELG